VLAAAIAQRLRCPVVSLDAINDERGAGFGGDGIPAEEWVRTHEIAVARIEELMTRGERIVLDDTNCYRWLRDKFRAIAERHGYRTVVISLDLPLSLLLERMKENEKTQERRAVQEKIFTQLCEQFEPPDASEEPLVFSHGDRIEPWMQRHLTDSDQTGKPMLILISGLPRAGKSSFADALESSGAGFTHVPLDKYIKEIPEGLSFLDWVDTPACIDWTLLTAHLEVLAQGMPCHTPQPDWNTRGRRAITGGRLMKPARVAYVIPGCHAFRMPYSGGKALKAFIQTPYETIAARLPGSAPGEEAAIETLRRHYTQNWQEVESYSKEADLIISGADARDTQIARLLDLIKQRRD
jgi:predicted kinase